MAGGCGDRHERGQPTLIRSNATNDRTLCASATVDGNCATIMGQTLPKAGITAGVTVPVTMLKASARRQTALAAGMRRGLR